jgi:hypothetical protein
LDIKDAGHSMIFRTFDGTLMLALHQPNRTPDERPVFRQVKEVGGQIKLK